MFAEYQSHGFVDGQIELWHNPNTKGSEENE